MSLTRDQSKQVYEQLMLKPSDISEAIINELLLDTSPEGMMNFVRQAEWSIYKDFPKQITNTDVPKFYDEIK